MSRPRFLADHDFNEHIIRGVTQREPAIDFWRLRELGLERSADDEVLDYAAANQLIVVSHDIRTMPGAARARLASGQFLSGLLLAQQRTPLAPIIEDLILIWAATEAEEWANQMNFLPIR
jgi:hypothetical protein